MSWKICPKTRNNRWSYGFYNSIKDLNESDWDAVVNDSNIYLSIPYLSALESSLQDEIKFRYIIFYNEDKKPVGVSAVQILKFIPQNNKYDYLLDKIRNKMKNKLLQAMDLKVMVCGNVFSCGENGFIFDPSITTKVIYQQLSEGLEKLRDQEKEKEKEKVSIMLIKEFWPSSFKISDLLLKNEFEDFKIDVNMVLPIHHSWKQLGDYLESMTTKFRTKAKGVFKKSKPLQIRDLNKEDLEHYKSQIQDLYLSVLEKADFKIGELNYQTFVELKEAFNKRFVMTGYFLDDQLVGFSSAFITESFVDAGYVGLNYDVNRTYAVYQRMLYDFVEMAINAEVKELRLGRTAEEIKSCLGAEPLDMKLYVRHKNSVSNKLLKPILQSISPREFELRKPFKVQFS